MSEDIDGVVSSVGQSDAVVIVISGKLKRVDAEKLRMELKKLIEKYQGLTVRLKQAAAKS